MSVASLLAKERIVAPPGYNRWLIPPAALCVHLCIGQAYAFSVFNLPMTKLIGITRPAPGDWKLTELGWIFSLAIFILGTSAALLGRWVEEGGPRKAMFTAALCFGGGFLVSALGVHLHQLWIIYLGYGLIGGIGLGLGYISPVSTLIKWFPDRPGMATGMAIMGFGGAAFIAAPAFGMADGQVLDAEPYRGRRDLRRPRLDLSLLYDGRRGDRTGSGAGLGAGRVCCPGATKASDHDAARLCLRRVEDAAILADLVDPVPQRHRRDRRARPGFGDEPGDVPRADHRGRRFGFCRAVQPVQHGRPVRWSSTSDYIGRKNTYFVFFALGTLLYALVPYAGSVGSVGLFVLCYAIIFSMYGGGFATVPAYLRDMFGTRYVGAIHGLLLTAWSMAGIFGPVLVNYIREYNITHGVARAQAYNVTMYVMAGLLIIGFICNVFVRSVHERFHMRAVHADVEVEGAPVFGRQ